MGKEGMGIGSASIVLIFAVLCLTIFALISLSSADNDKALTEANAAMVKAYYDADTLAEYILDEILTSDTIPDEVRGIEMHVSGDMFSFSETVSYSCPVSREKELFVEVSIGFEGIEILTWRLQDTREWKEEDDDRLPVWDGN